MPRRRSAPPEAAIAPPGSAGRRSARGRLLVVAALLASVGIAYLAASVADAARQEDPEVVRFFSGEELDVDLAAGEQRVVYLDPSLSGFLDFDYHPDDFACSATQGATPVPVVERREARYVLTERPSLSIGDVTAAEAGELRLTCPNVEGRSLPLLLARPGPAVRPALDPVLATVVALGLAAVAAVVAIATLVVTRRRDPSGTTPPSCGSRTPPTRH